VSSTVTLERVTATALDTDAGAYAEVTSGSAGGNTGAAMPSGVTIALKFFSGLTGRSQRGRMYLVGLSDGAVSGDQITDAAAAAFLVAWGDFFDSVATDESVLHVIVSYCNAGAWRTTAQNTDVAAVVLVDKNLDSQRRRLAGRGI